MGSGKADVNIMDVSSSERNALLQLVDTSVGSIQIVDLSVAPSDLTRTLHLEFRKAGFRQYPDSLPNGITFRPIPITGLTGKTGDRFNSLE